MHGSLNYITRKANFSLVYFQFLYLNCLYFDVDIFVTGNSFLRRLFLKSLLEAHKLKFHQLVSFCFQLVNLLVYFGMCVSDGLVPEYWTFSISF